MHQFFRPTLLALGGALLAPLVVQAATFEGQIDMTMTEGKQTHQVSYQTKKDHLRMSMPVPEMGEATAIIDFSASRMLMLMPQMKAYMEIPFNAAREAAHAKVEHTGELKKTGETTQILGYPCDQYLYEDKDGKVEIWATDQLGRFMSLPTGNPMQGGGAPKSGWEAAIQGDFFPMRLIAKNKKGKDRMKLEVTGVKKMSLPDSTFAPPADYKPFNMGAMMQGLGGLRGN